MHLFLFFLFYLDNKMKTKQWAEIDLIKLCRGYNNKIFTVESHSPKYLFGITLTIEFPQKEVEGHEKEIETQIKGRMFEVAELFYIRGRK